MTTLSRRSALAMTAAATAAPVAALATVATADPAFAAVEAYRAASEATLRASKELGDGDAFDGIVDIECKALEALTGTVAETKAGLLAMLDAILSERTLSDLSHGVSDLGQTLATIRASVERIA